MLTAVPLTVPVPLPWNVRMPSTANEREKLPATSFTCRFALKPEFGSATPGVGLASGGGVFGSPTWPCATRHAAVPVNPYDPLMLGAAAALPAPAKTRADIANANVRCMKELPGLVRRTAVALITCATARSPSRCGRRRWHNTHDGNVKGFTTWQEFLIF